MPFCRPLREKLGEEQKPGLSGVGFHLFQAGLKSPFVETGWLTFRKNPL